MSNATVLHNKIDSYVAGMYMFTHTHRSTTARCRPANFLPKHTHTHAPEGHFGRIHQLHFSGANPHEVRPIL